MNVPKVNLPNGRAVELPDWNDCHLSDSNPLRRFIAENEPGGYSPEWRQALVKALNFVIKSGGEL